MAKPRLKQTLADYVAQAISPALIMLLVGTLVFFLLEVSYDGQFEGRFQWILFWFVFANVLIARIAIEQGSDYASFYGLGLAGATALVVIRYLDAVIPAWVLLGVIWWCANQLTWDCTLTDDGEDASGEGLLAASGLGEGASASSSTSPSAADSSAKTPRRWWKSARRKTNQPHAPGMWVIYFSLAALPLFGIGQHLLPKDDAAARNYGFRLLWLYVAAALGLLLTTSFLGIRRYLRQRNLKMPATMSASWLGLGGMLIVGVLFVTLLIPRPDGVDGLAQLAERVDTVAGKASQWAMLGNEKTEGDGRRTGRADENTDEGNAESEADQTGKAGSESAGETGSGSEGETSGDGKSSDDGKSSSESGEEDSDTETARAETRTERTGESESGESETRDSKSGDDRDVAQSETGEDSGSSNDSSNAAKNGSSWQWPEWSLSFGKVVVYGGLILLAIIMAYRNRATILTVLARWWQEWLAFWANLLGSSAARKTSGAPEGSDESRPFSDFANPFHNGSASHMTPPELAQYTFDALQAWGLEQSCQRPAAQTPLEFAEQLGLQFPDAAREYEAFSQLYMRLAYSSLAPPANCYKQIEKFWRTLQTPIPL